MDMSTLVDAVVARRFADVHASFDEMSARDVPTAELERVWNEMLALLGDYRDRGEPVVMYDIPLRFARGDGHMQVVYRAGRVVGLVIRPGEPTAQFGQ